MPKAIITGASKGLGKALAWELANRGYDLLLIARSSSLLEDMAGQIQQQTKTNAHSLPLDLSEADSAKKILDWCREFNFNPTVLVNNAGYTCYGFFDTLRWAEQKDMLSVNLVNLVAITHALLPLLRQQPNACILNVSSTTAFQPVPTMAVYAASKSFVRSFSRSLRYELRKSTVSVTCLIPGTVATEFMNRAGMDALKPTAKKFEMKAEVVARAGLNAMFKKKAESIPGFTNYLSAKLTNLVPDAWLVRIAAGIYERFAR
jgi:uncharacterized protein